MLLTCTEDGKILSTCLGQFGSIWTNFQFGPSQTILDHFGVIWSQLWAQRGPIWLKVTQIDQHWQSLSIIALWALQYSLVHLRLEVSPKYSKIWCYCSNFLEKSLKLANLVGIGQHVIPENLNFGKGPLLAGALLVLDHLTIVVVVLAIWAQFVGIWQLALQHCLIGTLVHPSTTQVGGQSQIFPNMVLLSLFQIGHFESHRPPFWYAYVDYMYGGWKIIENMV